MKRFLSAALLTLAPTAAFAQVNAGTMASDPNLPFTMT